MASAGQRVVKSKQNHKSELFIRMIHDQKIRRHQKMDQEKEKGVETRQDAVFIELRVWDRETLPLHTVVQAGMIH